MNIDPVNIKYDSKNNIIVLKGRPEVSVDLIKQSTREIIEMSETENCKDVLIDATNTIKIPPGFELLFMGSFITEKVLKLIKLHIAFAVSDEISNDFRVFDTVLSNRMVNLHIFKNVDEAKEWLLKKE